MSNRLPREKENGLCGWDQFNHCGDQRGFTFRPPPDSAKTFMVSFRLIIVRAEPPGLILGLLLAKKRHASRTTSWRNRMERPTTGSAPWITHNLWVIPRSRLGLPLSQLDQLLYPSLTPASSKYSAGSSSCQGRPKTQQGAESCRGFD